ATLSSSSGPFPSQENAPENSNQNWSSLKGSDQSAQDGGEWERRVVASIAKKLKRGQRGAPFGSHRRVRDQGPRRSGAEIAEQAILSALVRKYKTGGS
ncbi:MULTISPECIES: hypothetical protein, partial [Rhizobium]